MKDDHEASAAAEKPGGRDQPQEKRPYVKPSFEHDASLKPWRWLAEKFLPRKANAGLIGKILERPASNERRGPIAQRAQTGTCR